MLDLIKAHFIDIRSSVALFFVSNVKYFRQIFSKFVEAAANLLNRPSFLDDSVLLSLTQQVLSIAVSKIKQL